MVAALDVAGKVLRVAAVNPRDQALAYRGRLGVVELLQVNDPVRGHILDRRAAATTIRAAAIAHGMTTMFEDALTKVFLGETTIDEAVRATA
jgi:type IV pilus assembly protein PilB